MHFWSMEMKSNRCQTSRKTCGFRWFKSSIYEDFFKKVVITRLFGVLEFSALFTFYERICRKYDHWLEQPSRISPPKGTVLSWFRTPTAATHIISEKVGSWNEAFKAWRTCPWQMPKQSAWSLDDNNLITWIQRLLCLLPLKVVTFPKSGLDRICITY